MLNTTHATNGNTTHTTTAIPTLDLASTQGTFESLLTAFDDVATVTGLLLLNDTLGKHQQQALLRLLQSHAFDYMTLCQDEHESITKHLAGTRWGDDTNTGGKL